MLDFPWFGPVLPPGSFGPWPHFYYPGSAQNSLVLASELIGLLERFNVLLEGARIFALRL